MACASNRLLIDGLDLVPTTINIMYFRDDSAYINTHPHDFILWWNRWAVVYGLGILLKPTGERSNLTLEH